MSKKSGKKGKPAPSRQQQQDAAARRKVGRATGTAGSMSAAAAAGPVTTAQPEGPGTSSQLEIQHYLDVSAVRIQEWLARTPDLKFRRGASIMLSQATGQDSWPDSELPAGTRWNTEAGDLDGVISLTVDDTVAAADASGCLAAAAGEVAAALRRDLPHCHIQAVTGAGDSYADAYRHIEQARQDGMFLVDSPPAPAELILAKPCDQCRAAPAERTGVEIVGGEQPQDLCGECHARLKAAGGTKGDRPGRSPRPERRMKAALEAAGMAVEGFPDNFRQLAEAGRHDSDDAATQLALIYADGNRVGAFLSEAAAHTRAGTGPQKSEIVRALDTATLAALGDAITACFASSGRPGVLAHLAGGDDLMVSVPAGEAWPFARALLAAFQERVAAAAAWPDAVRADVPSLSAGLVFHHLSAPFPDVVRLAKGQLDLAKAFTRGMDPSVAFLDLTADGAEPPAGRVPVTLDGLDGQANLLSEIACIPRSHRQTLVGLLRLSSEEDQAGMVAGRAETPAEALARRVVDLGYRPLWEVAAGPRSEAADVRRLLITDPGARQVLRQALDLARWWPPTSDDADVLPGAAAREVVLA